MTVNHLLSQLWSVTESDLVDAGEDYEGNPVFVIKFGKSVSTLIFGNQDAKDYPEFE